MTAPPPDIENCLYRGTVMHMRLTPFRHLFRYRVFSLLLDIDRIEQTCAPLRLLNADRFGLLSFHRKDHGPRDGSDLRPWAEALLAARGLERPHRIWLLSFPRVLGYAFNPLSVYYCMDGQGRMTAVIYEVRNTFGDLHPYVLPVEPGPDGAARHDQPKRFFVSPFIGMDQTYSFTLRAPHERLALRIRQGDADGPWLIAAQTGRRAALSDRALARAWLAHPAMTLKVIAAIHWQALRLWLKGAVFRRYPGAYPDHDTHPRRRAAEDTSMEAGL